MRDAVELVILVEFIGMLSELVVNENNCLTYKAVDDCIFRDLPGHHPLVAFLIK